MANEKTVELMRDNLRPLFEKTETAHAGLLIQRGLKKWEDGEKPTKQALIKKIADDVQASELYFLAFKRWLRHTYHTEDDTNFFATGASLTGRLFMGLPLGGTLETGVSTNHTYGVPMIAGSSVKGAVRAYTEQLFAKRKDSGEIDFEKRKNKNGTETLHYQFDDDKQAIINVLFGADDNSDAGYLIWHDAWWIPKATSKGELSRGEHNKPFAPEVVTVHHQKYYNGQLKEALDIENPVPNQQLAVEGGFYFVIEGVPAWAAYAGTLLKKVLSEQGLGAKSGSGYGYFMVDNKPLAPYQAMFKQQQEQAILEELEQKIQNLSPNQQLIEQFRHYLDNNLDKWEKKSPTMSYKPMIEGEYYEFADIHKKAMTWDDKQAMQTAYEMLSAYLPRFLGSKINQHKKWKERMNDLKARIES